MELNDLMLDQEIKNRTDIMQRKSDRYAGVESRRSNNILRNRGGIAHAILLKQWFFSF